MEFVGKMLIFRKLQLQIFKLKRHLCKHYFIFTPHNFSIYICNIRITKKIFNKKLKKNYNRHNRIKEGNIRL